MRRVGRALKPALVPILAIITAFIVGSLFIMITDFENVSKLGTDPAAAVGGAVQTIINAYSAMVVGVVEGEEATYEKVGMLMGGVH